MAIVDLKELIDAGVHFGHQASRWHPKMRPFIFGKRNLIHIIDLRETLKGLVRATNFLTRLVGTGKDVVLVGTKRQAKSIIINEARNRAPSLFIHFTRSPPSTRSPGSLFTAKGVKA